MKISEIKSTFSIRALNDRYVGILSEKFKTDGYEASYPVSVTSDGVLWDGNHRLAAAKKAGMKEIPAIVENPSNIRLAAHKRNTAASNALPETFVDHAEEIWHLLETGMTQQAVADEIGWSRSQVSQYALLKKINDDAWTLIATAFQKTVANGEQDPGAGFATAVTITENLLRGVIGLRNAHQLSIVSGLIDGSVKPKQVKALCETYAERESFVVIARERLLDQTENFLASFEADCLSGLYNSLDQAEKAIKQANEAYSKKNAIRVIKGDCLVELAKIEDESCNALIADPPYMILGEAWDTFKSKEEFLRFSAEWLGLAMSKIKSTGRAYIFWSQRHLFDFPFDAMPDRFTFGNLLIWNYKNNIKPNDQKIYKHTWEPCFYFYGKDAPKLNLPKSTEWGPDINDYDVFDVAQPQTNFSDKKEHPAQKPERLISRLISVGSDIGDTILDCFAGSGTTGVACKTLKRKAILIEKDEKYFKIINKRLADG